MHRGAAPVTPADALQAAERFATLIRDPAPPQSWIEALSLVEGLEDYIRDADPNINPMEGTGVVFSGRNAPPWTWTTKRWRRYFETKGHQRKVDVERDLDLTGKTIDRYLAEVRVVPPWRRS